MHIADIRKHRRHAVVYHRVLRVTSMAIFLGAIGYITFQLPASAPAEPTNPITFIRILQIRTLDPDATPEERRRLLRRIKYITSHMSGASVPDDIAAIVEEARQLP